MVVLYGCKLMGKTSLIKEFINNKDYVFAIEHVLNEELALEMKQKLNEQIGECEILVRELPAVVGAHMGIGGIGYQYIRKYEE